jgi:hypothetical protein
MIIIVKSNGMGSPAIAHDSCVDESEGRIVVS